MREQAAGQQAQRHDMGRLVSSLTHSLATLLIGGCSGGASMGSSHTHSLPPPGTLCSRSKWYPLLSVQISFKGQSSPLTPPPQRLPKQMQTLQIGHTCMDSNWLCDLNGAKPVGVNDALHIGQLHTLLFKHLEEWRCILKDAPVLSQLAAS